MSTVHSVRSPWSPSLSTDQYGPWPRDPGTCHVRSWTSSPRPYRLRTWRSIERVPGTYRRNSVLRKLRRPVTSPTTVTVIVTIRLGVRGSVVRDRGCHHHHLTHSSRGPGMYHTPPPVSTVIIVVRTVRVGVRGSSLLVHPLWWVTGPWVFCTPQTSSGLSRQESRRPPYTFTVDASRLAQSGVRGPTRRTRSRHLHRHHPLYSNRNPVPYRGFTRPEVRVTWEYVHVPSRQRPSPSTSVIVIGVRPLTVRDPSCVNVGNRVTV